MACIFRQPLVAEVGGGEETMSGAVESGEEIEEVVEDGQNKGGSQYYM